MYFSRYIAARSAWLAKTMCASGCGGLRCTARPTQRRRATRPEAGAEEWDESFEGQHFDGGAAGSFAIEARLDELLRGLPETLRIAVVLRYQEEMQPDEIAVLLGQPVATVKSHLQRALKLLRRKAAVTMKEYVRE